MSKIGYIRVSTEHQETARQALGVITTGTVLTSEQT